MCLTFLQQVPCPEDGCPAPVRQQGPTELDFLLSRLLEKGASLGAGLRRRALYSDTTFSPQRMPPIPACPMSPLGMAHSSQDSSLEAVLQISLKRPCHLPMRAFLIVFRWQADPSSDNPSAMNFLSCNPVWSCNVLAVR